ncbi:hypothetical protein C7M61_002199 [Candidozyma pseudohaemuli]|uniref:LicD/FKTN/FKRP nucleotidyltransferase domain-containing protein n=1 Tax=Candidozyma pseudohaemuli TaxID=418784 RepID=A0A2P7YSF2_9ASCO|nr:hypothetical protein C7M61_002199 [[Candida] pseudohaemulonii]PSK38894.1 hypothetical protein C7M61_002199 [[Candida] pseudohaemulonii]
MLQVLLNKINSHRKAAVAVLLAMVLVNLLIVLLSNYFLMIEIPDFLQGSFDNRKNILFLKVRNNPKKYWLSDAAELHYLDADVPLDQVMPTEQSKTDNTLWYDPRFTLSVYLNELINNDGKEDMPVYPFHWSDWIDLTGMNKYFVDQDRMTCNKLKSRIRGRPDVLYFCKDKHELSTGDIERMGWTSLEQVPDAVIFAHCKHDHNTYNDHRSYMAKSYGLTNLPKPLKVIILNKESGTYEFYVDQSKGPEQRLKNSGLTDRFLRQALGTSAQAVAKAGNTFTVNHMKLYKKLLGKVKPKMLPKDDDPYGVYQVTHNNKGDLPLNAEIFHYDRSSVDDQIRQYEGRSNLSVMEQNYLAGLRECAPYNDETELTYFKEPTLNTKEYRNKDNDVGWHYDWRFFTDALMYDKEGWTRAERTVRTNIILERLLRNWSRFVEEKGLVSWIEHGPLLSWYWDGLMFPYDNDIDVQMPVMELLRLSRDYNQTLVLEDPSEGYGKFLIDIGTYVHNRGISKKENHIDGRFIDVDSGIYIDITGLAKSEASLPQEYKDNPIVEKLDGDLEAEVYNDRRKHFYTLEQLQPLHYSMISGVPVFIPQQIENRLRFSYKKGLEDYEFNGWLFVPSIGLWLPKEKVIEVLEKAEYTREGKEEKELLIEATKNLTEEQILKLLQDDDTLVEYFFTVDYTEFHSKEMDFLFDKNGKDSKKLQVASVRNRYKELTKNINMRSPMRKCLFEYEKYDRIKHHSET